MVLVLSWLVVLVGAVLSGGVVVALLARCPWCLELPVRLLSLFPQVCLCDASVIPSSDSLASLCAVPGPLRTLGVCTLVVFVPCNGGWSMLRRWSFLVVHLPHRGGCVCAQRGIGSLMIPPNGWSFCGEATLPPKFFTRLQKFATLVPSFGRCCNFPTLPLQGSVVAISSLLLPCAEGRNFVSFLQAEAPHCSGRLCEQVL